MGINVRADMIFPELRAPANAEVALREGEECRMIVIITVLAELEEATALIRTRNQPCVLFYLTAVPFI